MLSRFGLKRHLYTVSIKIKLDQVINQWSFKKNLQKFKQINRPEKNINSPEKQCKASLPVLRMPSKQANTSDVGKCSKLIPALPEWPIIGQLK